MIKLKNEKGVTIISLVITIVILTIILTISMSVSNVNNGLIDETKTVTKDSQINKYIELIEITRQEVLSREYVLEIKGSTNPTNDVVLNEMYRIMTEDSYADKIYTQARPVEDHFSIEGTEQNKYILFETVEGYEFKIYKDKTEYVTN